MKKILALIALVMACHVSNGQTTTLARADDGCYDTLCYCFDAYGGDGGHAIAYGTCYNGIRAVIPDHSGNILLSDNGNFRIRKINSSGIITTICGNGVGGYSGDGGQATAARIDDVRAMCTDRYGNCYFADALRRIRKVNISTGVVTTVAGNGAAYSADGVPATSTGIGDVWAFTIDNSDNIYLSDNSGSRVRKVSAGSGIISTIAGSSTSGFSGDGGAATDATIDGPVGIVVDSFGTVYFADANNSRIRKISTTGIITTIGGGGTSGYDGRQATSMWISPIYLGLDTAHNLYFYGSDGSICRIKLATGVINWLNLDFTPDGSGSGCNQMYVDSAGNFYGGAGTPSGWYPSGAVKALATTTHINTWDIWDSVRSANCPLPGKFAFNVQGTMNDTASASDSVTVSISASNAFGDLAISNAYRIPYWNHTGTFGFGSPFCTLDTLNFPEPGTYTGEIWLSALGGEARSIPYTYVASANCGSGVTGINSFDIWDTLLTPTCVMPGLVKYIVSGTVAGSSSTADSMYEYIDFPDGAHERHIIPISSGNYVDTFYHTFTTAVYSGAYIRLVTSSGMGAAQNWAPDVAVTDCTAGWGLSGDAGDYSSAFDYDGYFRYSCSLPYTAYYSFGGGVGDSAEFYSTVTRHFYFGDGTDTIVTAPVTYDGRGHYGYGGSFSHTFTMNGDYTEYSADTIGPYHNALHAVSYYPLYVGSACSPLSGTFYIDANGNCIKDAGEVALSYWPYSVTNNTRGYTTQGWADANGHYVPNVFAGDSFTVVSDPLSTAGSGTSVVPSCPSSGSFSFLSTAASDTQDFAFTCISPTVMDMSISGWGWHFFPGDTGYIAIWSSNPWGFMCDSLNSTVTLVIDSNLSYCGMWRGPLPDVISGDTLKWNFSTSGSLFDFGAYVLVRTDTSSTIFDTTHNLLFVSPTTITDPDMSNNSYTWRQPVVASWDPNEKQVSPQGFGPEGYIRNGTPLSYMIHFQNTGSAPARNITVSDTIDGNLDISTLQVAGSSAPVVVYQFGNVIKFRFNDIYLPDSASHPDASIGFISYNIQPYDSLAPGTQIKNMAGIYFDYNPAVYTNATMNTIEDVIGPITGIDSVCPGSTITLSNTLSGGAWHCSNGHATISPAGVVTGITAGLDTISYVAYGELYAYKTIRILGMPGHGVLSGASSLCTGESITISTTVPGGTWSTSGSSVTVSGGVVTGVSIGTDTVWYSVSNSCGSGVSSWPLTVGLSPGAGSISGAALICEGASTTMTATVSGGTWSSSSSAVATVSASGVVTGTGGGVATITYALSASCGSLVRTQVMTINPLPSAGALTGATTICAGTTTTLSYATTGGAWSSASPSIATITSSGIVTAAGTGIDTIYYTLTNTCGTTTTSAILRVNTVPAAAIITGITGVCPGTPLVLTASPTGGVWSSTVSSIATVSAYGHVTSLAGGTDSIGYALTNSCGTTTAMRALIVTPVPHVSAISVPSHVCVLGAALLTDSLTGGTWVSSAPTVATIDTTGLISGLSSGTTTVLYTYTNACGTDATSTTVTVNPMTVAGSILGVSSVCASSSITFTPSVSGGFWSSSIPGIAAVIGGTVSGISAGTATISYTVIDSCGSASATAGVTVFPLPSAGLISGLGTLCPGGSLTLSSSSTSGRWASAGSAISITSLGVISGVSTGPGTVYYIDSNSCGVDSTFAMVTVNPLPDAGTISGVDSLCPGDSVTLAVTIAGGLWSSSNTSIASVSAGGVVLGFATGTAIITYAITNSCGTATTTRPCSIRDMVDCSTGIEFIGRANAGVDIFPNPGNGIFEVLLPQHDGLVKIAVADVLGQIVKLVTCSGKELLVPIDVSDVAPGTYIVKIHVNNESFRKKLIVR